MSAAAREPLAAAVAERIAGSTSGRRALEALPRPDGVHVVGGAVRDAVLDRPVDDLDLVSEGDPAEVAAALAAPPGAHAFRLSEEFGTWRVAWHGGGHVDITGVRGAAIADDLARRDFTVNAIAIPLGTPPEVAELIDPGGGLGDLEAGILRAVSDRSFEDDPLRVLRAARIAAQLGFEIEPATAEIARATATRAGEPAGERQLAELRLLVGGPDPLRGVELLGELGATGAVLPELDALHGVGQTANHHLDVYDHTIAVLANLLEVERDLERFAGPSAGAVADLLAEPLGDQMTRGTALRFGALLHDSAKPITRQAHDGGRVSFKGHDREGVAVVRAAFSRLKASRALSRYVEGVTLHHLHLGFMVHERPLPRRRLYAYLKLCEPVAADVTVLTIADRLAARGSGPIAAEEVVQAHLELAREVLPEALAWHRDGPPRSPIAGDELAAALGIEPGPALGALIDEVEAGVFTGDVETADDAVRVARAARSG